MPVYGYRRIGAVLRQGGNNINGKRVLRLMRELGVKARYPGPNTSAKAMGDMIYPYLLEDIKIDMPNKVWQIDITYLRTNQGFMYLVALIDVYSRIAISARLSNSLEVGNTIRALEDGVYRYGRPAIINSDQGRQFTSKAWIESLQNYGINISMTGKGRCVDNAYVERLWRTIKQEGAYLFDWRSARELKAKIAKWLEWYNKFRPHQSLNYKTPHEVFYSSSRTEATGV